MERNPTESKPTNQKKKKKKKKKTAHPASGAKLGPRSAKVLVLQEVEEGHRHATEEARNQPHRALTAGIKECEDQPKKKKRVLHSATPPLVQAPTPASGSQALHAKARSRCLFVSGSSTANAIPSPQKNINRSIRLPRRGAPHSFPPCAAGLTSEVRWRS